MIHPGAGDTSTVRSVFIVDPDDKLRLMLTYPKSVGRNFDEILRVIDALQATDEAPIATPADWQPGDRVIVALGVSTDEAKEKFSNVEEVKPYLRYADAPQ
jgi:alkyl hydroperoxide reductase subunit AhpC